MFSNLINLIIGLIILIEPTSCDRTDKRDLADNFDSLNTSDLLLKPNNSKPNLNRFKEFNYLLCKKKSTCCTNRCSDAKNSPFKLTGNNSFPTYNGIQLVQDKSRNENRTAPNRDLDASSPTMPKKRFKLDVSASIRNFVNQLRPQSPFSFNSGLNQLNYNKYAPNSYSYGFRPLSSNLGINYGLDIAPGYSDFAPFIGNGLGSSLGTPYGTGLGIGSSFGIYDNIYPNSIGTSKSTVLRRKLVPSEGVLLLEVEDPLNDGLSHENMPLGRNGNVNLNNHHFNHDDFRSNFGRPKFSLKLSSNSPVELNSETSNRDLSIYSNRISSNQINNVQQFKPYLSKENLINFDELSKNPHQNRISRPSIHLNRSK